MDLTYRKMYCNKIDNPLNVPMETKEIYNGIFEHIIPEDYYFESAGCSYGNRVYTSKIPSNYYIIKKRESKNDEKTV